MTKVEDKEFVVHVMVSGRAKAEKPEQWVPWVCVFRVDEHEPVGIECAKCHVRPHIGWHQTGYNDKRQYNHERCVGERAVERIKEAWVGEAVVRFVGVAVDPGRDLVLTEV